MVTFLASPFLILILATITLLAIAVPLVRMVLIYRGVDRRLPFDASPLGLVPPQELHVMVGGLMRLGLRRLGEVQLDLPGLRLVQFKRTGSPSMEGPAVTRHTAYLFLDPTGTIIAETAVVHGGPVLMSFMTTFGDGTVVETMYPLGESIDDPDLHIGHVTSSLEAAYDEQRIQVDRWRMRHGTPRRIETVADYLRDEANYRARFGKRKLRGPFVRRQLIPAAVMSVVVIIGAVMLLER